MRASLRSVGVPPAVSGDFSDTVVELSSLPHPCAGGHVPTLRFRMFRKRVRRVPHAANARHGRFDLDAKRSFRLLPRTLLLSRCKWPRRWVKFRFYLCVFYASPGALVRPPDTFP